jgi:glucan phosphoethanolaminetransferase (alkaline phosphatase superfamily)
MHVYGHARENTPFLSRLHREGRLVRFDNAFSVCTESHCGLLAILAARYWHEMSTGRKPFGLADVLSRLGYRTHFLLGGDHTNFYDLRSFYGDSVDEYIDGSSASRYMNDDAEVIEWLRRLDVNGAAPRFIYVHLMSTHIVGKRHARFNLWRRQPLAGAGARCCSAAQVYQNNYHQGVRQADALIEEMFAILEAKGLLQDVLIAITADHGEMLGEFGVTLGHGGPPRDPVVRVPLLLYDARGFAYPPRRLASVIDVAPTLLDRIGAPVPELWSGMPLSRPEQPRFVFAQTRDEISVIGDFGGELYKYYYRTRPGALAEELVRLGPPGAEHTVPAGERPQVLSALRAELDRQLPGLRRAR